MTRLKNTVTSFLVLAILVFSNASFVYAEEISEYNTVEVTKICATNYRWQNYNFGYINQDNQHVSVYFNNLSKPFLTENDFPPGTTNEGPPVSDVGGIITHLGGGNYINRFQDTEDRGKARNMTSYTLYQHAYNPIDYYWWWTDETVATDENGEMNPEACPEVQLPTVKYNANNTVTVRLYEPVPNLCGGDLIVYVSNSNNGDEKGHAIYWQEGFENTPHSFTTPQLTGLTSPSGMETYNDSGIWNAQLRNACGVVYAGIPFTAHPSTEVTNQAPVLSTVGNKVVSEGQQLQFTLQASDPDGDFLTYIANNLPSGSTFNPLTKTFSWVPMYNQSGNYENIEFTVVDDGIPIELDTELITITVGNVNRAPEFNAISPKEVLEEEQLQFNVQVTDPDGDSITLSAESVPQGAVFNAQTGSFSWTPTQSQSGNYIVTFKATDNGNPSEVGLIEVPVTVGDLPTPTQQADIINTVVVNYNFPTNIENAYLSNLKKVAIFIENGQIQAAINQLKAFISKVQQDYTDGKITQVVRNDLINKAQTLLNNLQ